MTGAGTRALLGGASRGGLRASDLAARRVREALGELLSLVLSSPILTSCGRLQWRARLDTSAPPGAQPCGTASLRPGDGAGGRQGTSTCAKSCLDRWPMGVCSSLAMWGSQSRLVLSAWEVRHSSKYKAPSWPRPCLWLGSSAQHHGGAALCASLLVAPLPSTNGEQLAGVRRVPDASVTRVSSGARGRLRLRLWSEPLAVG